MRTTDAIRVSNFYKRAPPPPEPPPTQSLVSSLPRQEERLTLIAQYEALLLPANAGVVLPVVGVEGQDGRVQVGQLERGVVGGDNSHCIHGLATVGVVSP